MTKDTIEKKSIPAYTHIKDFAISVDSHIHAEIIQEHLEEDLDIVQKVYILDEEDINDTNIPLLKINIKSSSSPSIWKFLGLGVIPTYQNQNFSVEAEFVKNQKKIIGWSFNIESRSYFGIWFLPFIYKYDSEHCKAITLIINNIMSDLIAEKIL